MKRIFLSETLKENDLFMLVDNVILIDEHESKFNGDDYIVVAFIVKTKDALSDLKSFIQIACSSDVFVVDEKYYYDYDYDAYLLFVEFERNLNFPDKLLHVLEKVSYLCGNSIWKMKIGNIDRLFTVNTFNLKKYVSFTLIDKNKGKIIKEALNSQNMNYNSPFTRYFSLNDDVYEILALASEKDLNYYLREFFKNHSREIIENSLYSNNPYFFKSENYLIIKNGDYYPIAILATRIS